LFTVCPKCTLTLVVTTVDLRAGQGYVRCGRCANVFNALIALREGDPNGTTSDSANRRLLETAPKGPIEPAFGAGVAVEPEPAPEPPPAPEIEAGYEADVASIDESSMEFDPVATDVSEIFIAPPTHETDIASGSYEAVVLSEEPVENAVEAESALEPEDLSHTDTIAAEDWSLIDDAPEAEPQDVAADESLADESAAGDETVEQSSSADPPWVEEMFAEAEAEASRGRSTKREMLHVAPNDDEPVEVRAARDVKGVSAASGDTALEPLFTPPVLRPKWQYVSGIALLALLLILQLLHHNRQSLALNPSFGPMATRIYRWLGVTLVPRWDLTAYSVKQLGADAEGTEGTRLRVRLSLQNESARVQPLPLLRLTLQDRYGNAVATRDLEPRDYLPKRAADQSLLEPDQRIDAELHVIDPGKAAIGFEIDACLRGEGGDIGCANEARHRAAG
jgi:predicted Zn finger-like uncharacterized protein